MNIKKNLNVLYEPESYWHRPPFIIKQNNLLEQDTKHFSDLSQPKQKMTCVPINKITNKKAQVSKNSDIPYILELCIMLTAKSVFSIYIGKSATEESNQD